MNEMSERCESGRLLTGSKGDVDTAIGHSCNRVVVQLERAALLSGLHNALSQLSAVGRQLAHSSRASGDSRHIVATRRHSVLSREWTE